MLGRADRPRDCMLPWKLPLVLRPGTKYLQKLISGSIDTGLGVQACGSKTAWPQPGGEPCPKDRL